MFSEIQCIPWFKNEAFLRQKYIVEKLSTKEIASELFSSHSTVLKYLKINGIPIRGSGQDVKKRRKLFYGRRIVNRQEVPHMAELANVEKAKRLRGQGFSYWKIAEVFNAMKVPTKTRKGRWHARSIQKVLDDSKLHVTQTPEVQLSNS